MLSNKLIKAVSILLLLVLMASVGCSHKPDDQPEPTQEVIDVTPTEAPATEEPTAEPTADPAPAFAGNELPGRDGSVCAVPTGTYGVATDGSIRFMGRPVSGQNLIYDWQGVVRVAASDNTTVALLEDGTLKMTGTHAEDFAEAEGWTDIAAISVGEAHLVCLHTDGTVSAVGDNSRGQCNVSGWRRVIAVFAVDDFTVALTDRWGAGLINTYYGDLPVYQDESVEFVSMAAASDHVALLTSDGRVFTCGYVNNAVASRDDDEDIMVRADVREMSWSNIKKIYAAEGETYAIDEAGTLYTDSDLFASFDSALEFDPKNNVYSVAASGRHAVLLYGNGTAKGFGDNADLQCNLDVWRLMPYLTDDGYVLGFSEGDIVNGELYRTGLELPFADPVTGEQHNAVAVLLGDLDGNGEITQADRDLINAYRSGDAQLEGAYLRAANIIDDDRAPGEVDFIDAYALKQYIESGVVIDQFAKKDMYTTPIANARRVNTDTIGYIKIEGTNINYPIMYGADWYYHTRGLSKEYLERGSIYSYWSQPGKNIVITGHNARTSGTMFHQLHYVQNNSAQLSDFANRLWCINVYGETGYWEVWAMYEEGAFAHDSDSSLVYNTCYPRTMESMSEQEVQGWIFYQMERTELKYKVNVSTEERFMTIVTCGDTHAASEKGSRLYFFLRWVGGN